MLLSDFLLEAGEQPIYYFAYGMLTDPEIMEGIDLVGVAVLPNFRYEMLQYANVFPDSGSTVYGCLWRVNRQVISNLDQIEGYPQLYDRKTVPAYVDGKKYVAELYTMTPATRNQLSGTMPEQSYVNKIVRGYSHAGVPLEQVRSALKSAYKQHTGNAIDEARMSPSAFADAVDQGTAKGVLVGFEFEVLVPEATISGAKQPDSQKITADSVSKIINDNNAFDDISISSLPPNEFDSVFKLKPDYTAKYPTATEAYTAYRQNIVQKSIELFNKIPENLRQKYVPEVKRMLSRDREWNSLDDLDKQLRFANAFGYKIYQTQRGKAERLGYDLRNQASYSYWDGIFRIWLGLTSDDVSAEVNSIFNFNPEQVYKQLDLSQYDDYDDYDDYHDYDYSGASKVLQPAVTQYFNTKVNVFSEYHERNKNLTDWYIEPDGSLSPENDDDGAAEIVSPPLSASQAMTALKNFYAMAKQLGLYTNSSTGLHINVSIPQDIDLLKLAVFLGDQYVLQQFGREDNDYAKSAQRTIAQQAPGQVKKSGQIDFKKLTKIANDATGFHTASISNSGKYISFRHAGGDYLADYTKIVNTVGRFIRAMLIASDPNAYAQEYKTKVAKLVSPQNSQADSLAIDIRTNGVPVYTVYIWSTGRSKIEKIVKNLPYQWRNSNWNSYVIQDVQTNSELAKQNIVNAMQDQERKDAAKAESASRFITVTVVPVDSAGIDEIKKSVDRGVQRSSDGYTRFGFGLIRKNNLPPTHPTAQNLLKLILRKQLKKK